MQIATIFLQTATLCYLLIWILYKSPVVTLFKDKPGKRKVHQRTIPRIGGLAIILGFLLMFFIYKDILPSRLHSPLFFATLAIFSVGISDDIVNIGINNGSKLFTEIIIATIIVFFYDININQIHFLQSNFDLGWIGKILSVIWIVGITNAINIIDGADGLAGSIMFVFFATIATLTGFSGDYPFLILCIILAGLVTGFLFHNISPARLFLGDTGSLFLGLLAALLSLFLISNNQNYPAIIAPLMLGLPLIDIIMAMARRFFVKFISTRSFHHSIKAMTIADNEHTHHRLIHKGLTHSQTVLIMVLFHLNTCICAVMVCFTSNFISVILICYVATLTFLFLYELHYFENLILLLKKIKTHLFQKKELVATICYDNVLQYSLKKYKQNQFSFLFNTFEKVLISPKSYCSVVIEQEPGKPLYESISLASTICMQYTCPVIIICSNDESLQLNFNSHSVNQKSFMLIKKPVYIPSLLKDLNLLINRNKSGTIESKFF